jgi:hypothetical protein
VLDETVDALKESYKDKAGNKAGIHVAPMSELFSSKLYLRPMDNFGQFFIQTPSTHLPIRVAMFETICTLPLTSDVFAQAIHPREPVLSIGLSSGHVQTLRLPAAPLTANDDDDDDGQHAGDGANGAAVGAARRGCGQIATQWRTRRHKVSCRCLHFSPSGETLYSGGGDGIVKAASAETGQVASKIVVANAPYVLPPPLPSRV